ncbi:MAG TPA: glycosyltransferase family 1 protein [Bryobacteraceae bacterium]|nr:glycosyltransferase family 1 protein [Bryobacteraceae bacterium]
MRFSVDAHAIGRHLTGNEVYIRSLLTAFEAVDRESEFLAYLSEPEAADLVPARFGKRWVSSSPFVRLGFQFAWQLRRDRPALLHVQYTAPAGCPVPVVVSLHDVSFVEHPEYFTPARSLQLRLTVRKTVKHAAKILTGSEFSRNAIARVYGLDPARISVVANAAGSHYHPIAREAALAAVRQRFEIPSPFILTVGDLQPRKNQVGLIRAFDDMLAAKPTLPHHLVLAGKEQFNASAVLRAVQRSPFADRIHLTGFVPDEVLPQLYNACEFFVFPSFYEGFGLPVLEAMACGRAVACSNSSAVHEVADAAALLFDPTSTEQMARAMTDLAVESELRARMERLGLQRAAQFSWKRTAQRTLEIYNEVAERPQRAMTSAASL